MGITPTFASGIDSRIKDVDYVLALAKERFTRDQRYVFSTPSDEIDINEVCIRSIRRNTSEDNHSSYVLHEMFPAYRSAFAECGTNFETLPLLIDLHTLVLSSNKLTHPTPRTRSRQKRTPDQHD